MPLTKADAVRNQTSTRHQLQSVLIKWTEGISCPNDCLTMIDVDSHPHNPPLAELFHAVARALLLNRCRVLPVQTEILCAPGLPCASAVLGRPGRVRQYRFLRLPSQRQPLLQLLPVPMQRRTGSVRAECDTPVQQNMKRTCATTSC